MNENGSKGTVLQWHRAVYLQINEHELEAFSFTVDVVYNIIQSVRVRAVLVS